ncbi:hypothetical protein KDM41_01745 [bacterium]|nr:hypothetical protein [bacterium]
MINRRNSYAGLLFAAVLGALLLTGCRAFEPEAVIVNKPPETFIIGAPIEDGGGYYHFHVFWYGSDADGRVERFVWALTDTTIQDDDTTDDEEDQNFNPALDASTLEIANWTTRTDSVFNFTIDQGTNQAADMTLHMVAIDDFGAYDRTPARLHFFSNTLGNPSINFYRVLENGTRKDFAAGERDTVGYGFPYEVHWEGTSPNIRGYAPEALALLDTVPPVDDGLFGYKWQLLGDLGGGCLPSLQDCWHPRRFNEATGDSFSYFGPATALRFENNDSGSSPFRKLLPSGSVSLEVNSIDIAGVEVAEFARGFSFVVNYDPQTLVLDGETDFAHPEDPQQYPYYTLLNDTQAEPTRYPFQSGDRIPDRSYVVVKALARDDPRDAIQDPTKPVGLAGYVQGVRSNFFGGTFSFSTESSVLDRDPTWPATCDTCWAADTLGFMVGPSSSYTFNMQSVDEHDRRDGSPAKLTFDVGYPPCLQCIEFQPKTSMTSAYNLSLECIDDPATHPCFQDTPEMRVTATGAQADALQYIQDLFMLVDKQTYFVNVSDTNDDQAGTKYVVQAKLYRMTILLHSKDDAREAWSLALRRSGAFAYQIDYECDPFNQIKDGGGNDDILSPTWGAAGDGVGLRIDPASGLWRLEVDVVVPTTLVTSGPATYLTLLTFIQAGGDPAIAQDIFDATVKQFGNGQIRVVAIDQTQCNTTPRRPGSYNYFKQVRPTVSLAGTASWRDCDSGMPGLQGSLPLSRGAMSSHPLAEPISMDFRLVIDYGTGTYTCEMP